MDSSLETEFGRQDSPPFYSSQHRPKATMEEMSIQELENIIKSHPCSNFAELKNLMEIHDKMIEKRLERSVEKQTQDIRKLLEERIGPLAEKVESHQKAIDELKKSEKRHQIVWRKHKLVEVEEANHDLVLYGLTNIPELEKDITMYLANELKTSAVILDAFKIKTSGGKPPLIVSRFEKKEDAREIMKDLNARGGKAYAKRSVPKCYQEDFRYLNQKAGEIRNGGEQATVHWNAKGISLKKRNKGQTEWTTVETLTD